MSRGISKLQQAIIRILSGSQRNVYRGSGPLTTAEVLDELTETGQLDDRRPRKQLMATIVRAGDSLIRRNLVTATDVPDGNNPGRTTIEWKANPTKGSI